jgi:hypothetical protein
MQFPAAFAFGETAAQLPEIKIFDGRFSRSVALWIFHPLFRHAASFANSIALRRILLPAFQIFSREVDSSTAKRFVCRYPVLSAHGNGGIGGNPEVPPDFRRGSPPAKS